MSRCHGGRGRLQRQQQQGQASSSREEGVATLSGATRSRAEPRPSSRTCLASKQSQKNSNQIHLPQSRVSAARSEPANPPAAPAGSPSESPLPWRGTPWMLLLGARWRLPSHPALQTGLVPRLGGPTGCYVKQDVMYSDRNARHASGGTYLQPRAPHAVGWKAGGRAWRHLSCCLARSPHTFMI